MLFSKASVLAILAAPFALAADPLCLDPSGRLQLYDRAFSREVPDGRILAFCYSTGFDLSWTIDDNWVNDIDAMLSKLVQFGNDARCVDCKPTAEDAGCTGFSTIWNIDGNDLLSDWFDATPPPIDQYSKDVFMDIIRQMKDEGVQLNAFGTSSSNPILTIDTVGGGGGVFREQQFTIKGDGDTC